MKTIKLKDIDLYAVGNTVQMVGALYGGNGELYVILFPDEKSKEKLELTYLEMDSEDWKTFLRQTDYMEAEVLRKDSQTGEMRKAIMRKSQRQIDQILSWKVFKRDGYACCYCGNDNTPLTVDHLIAWENGGPSIEENLLTACRKCNRTRGNTLYADWMQHPYYLDVSQRLSAARRRANESIVARLNMIPIMVHARSR